MDLNKLFQFAEELLYQIALWAILFPKTLLKILVTPWWIPRYIAEEIRKEARDRFDEYMSPIMFLLVGGPIPTYLISRLPKPEDSEFEGPSQVGQSFFALFGWAGDYKLQAYAVLWVVLGPLSFTLAHHWSIRQRISRASMKPFFYSQCYCLAPIGVLLNGNVIFGRFLWDSLWYDPLMILMTMLMLGWLLYTETCVFKADLKVSTTKAFGLTWVGILVFYLFVSPYYLLTFFTHYTFF